MCGYKNNFISLIIQQEKRINQSKQSSNKPIENTKNKNNLWKCNKCGTINKNDICIKCEKKKERNIKFNSVDYKKINKNQDSSYNYYDSEENSKINEIRHQIIQKYHILYMNKNFKIILLIFLVKIHLLFLEKKKFYFQI